MVTWITLQHTHQASRDSFRLFSGLPQPNANKLFCLACYWFYCLHVTFSPSEMSPARWRSSLSFLETNTTMSWVARGYQFTSQNHYRIGSPERGPRFICRAERDYNSILIVPHLSWAQIHKHLVVFAGQSHTTLVSVSILGFPGPSEGSLLQYQARVYLLECPLLSLVFQTVPFSHSTHSSEQK